MPKRFKEARLAKKIKVSDAIEILGISQPTLSAWESGRKSPSLNSLILMAQTYGVSTDYLLGLDNGNLVPSEPIPLASIPLFHGKPVWSKSRGWAIVDAINGELVFPNQRTSIADTIDIYSSADKHSFSNIPTENHIPYNLLKKNNTVWIEPISSDDQLRQELRGWYTVKDRYAENDHGNRFYFDSYEAKWLAFNKQI